MTVGAGGQITIAYGNQAAVIAGGTMTLTPWTEPEQRHVVAVLRPHTTTGPGLTMPPARPRATRTLLAKYRPANCRP